MRHIIKDKSKLVAKKLRAGERKRINPTAFKGYPGLANTASEIALHIPKVETFVEPFAGLGRISKFVKADHYVLNDLSDYAVKHCRKHFREATITQQDYREITLLYPDAYKFYDPPWYDDLYEDNPLCALTRSYKILYDEILHDVTHHTTGDWMVAGAANGPLKDWPNIQNNPNGFYHKEIQSRKKALFGLKARTYLVSNKPFVNHWQAKLF